MKDLGEVRRILGMKLKETELREIESDSESLLTEGASEVSN